MKHTIWLGYEPRETNAYMVAVASIRRYWPAAPIRPIILDRLRKDGLYRRDMQRHNGQIYDVISDAPMSTEFAISRFLTPILAETGWALFMDCDMLVRCDLRDLFALADQTKAVMCVQHEHTPDRMIKMDDQIQLRYGRKNWSSVVLFNCDHPANTMLTTELINALPGRDLHAFSWLSDADIGELGPEWNHLVGISEPHGEPNIVHFTSGIPSMPGYADCPFSDEWREVLWRAMENL